MEHKDYDKTLSNHPTLHGVKGWLSFFIFCSIWLAPIVGPIALSSSLSIERAQYPQILSDPAYPYYVGVRWIFLFFAIIFQAWAAYELKTKFVPRSVFFVKSLLISTLVINMAINSIFLPFPFAVTLLASLINSWSTILWLLYFMFSKRIQYTYFFNAEQMNYYVNNCFDRIEKSLNDKYTFGSIHNDLYCKRGKKYMTPEMLSSIYKKIESEKIK